MKTKKFMQLAICLVFILAFASVFAQQDENGIYRKEEIIINAGDFTIVGDLYIPITGTKHPVAIWVHGSGPLTRQIMVPLIKPQIETFIKAGFAFFIDDIPGSGASKGQIKNVFMDRASILVSEVEAMKKRNDILQNQIGVVGSSQAGIVMPLATTLTSGIKFMITEGCVAECSYKQDAYLLKSLIECDGGSSDFAERMANLYLKRYETLDWNEYCSAVDTLNNNEYVKLCEMNNPRFSSEEKFKNKDRSSSKLGSYYDPMPIVSTMKIPVLALFGDKDKNINPIQGIEAYKLALEKAQNKFYKVEMIPNTNHILFECKTGCVRELQEQVKSRKPNYNTSTLNVISEWLEMLKKNFENE